MRFKVGEQAIVIGTVVEIDESVSPPCVIFIAGGDPGSRKNFLFTREEALVRLGVTSGKTFPGQIVKVWDWVRTDFGWTEGVRSCTHIKRELTEEEINTIARGTPEHSPGTWAKVEGSGKTQERW